MTMNSFKRRRQRLLMIPALVALCLVAGSLPAGDAAVTAGLTRGVSGSADTQSADDGTVIDDGTCAPLLSHSVRPLMAPEARPLCDAHAGNVLLFVNTASKCGFTPQFEALEILHQRYRERGFKVLGFPSADFRQELRSEAAVAEFCQLNYGVTFPMYQKLHVTGADAHPLFHALAAATGQYPRWNFNKYLIDREGTVIRRFDSNVQPLGEQLVSAIEKLL